MLDRFRVVYRINVSADGPVVTHGSVPARFLSAVRDVIALHGIERGTIECKGRGRKAPIWYNLAESHATWCILV